MVSLSSKKKEAEIKIKLHKNFVGKIDHHSFWLGYYESQLKNVDDVLRAKKELEKEIHYRFNQEFLTYESNLKKAHEIVKEEFRKFGGEE